MITVLLVEDQELIRMGILMVFSDNPEITIVDSAENGEVAIEKYENCQPDVVLMDINMPVMNGLEAARRIKLLNRNVKIIFLTSNDTLSDVFGAFSVGASGYCIKDIEPKKLVQSVKTVYKNGLCLDSRLAESMLQFVSSKEALPPSDLESSMEGTTILNVGDVSLLQDLARGSEQETIEFSTKLKVLNLLHKIVILNKSITTLQYELTSQRNSNKNEVTEKFDILEEVGNGASCNVFKAQNKLTGKMAAIKIFKTFDRLTFWDRFIQEAAIMSRLSHPNVVAVQDFIIDKNRTAYMIMDLIDGPTLSTVLECGGSIIEKEAIPIFSQCLRALDYLHNEGIIHRDIKPSNILLYSENQESICAKLTDFGIARNLNAKDERFTLTGEILGSPLYMSPEQCRADEIDTRSDIYSFGCVMYEVLTGLPPYISNSCIDTMYMHMNSPSPVISDKDKKTSSAMRAIVTKCLSKEPDGRFGTARELLNQIESLTYC